MRQKAKVSTLISILTSSAGDCGPVVMIFQHEGRREGQPMLPDLAGAAQLRASGNFSCWYSAHRCLGMTLISANTLAFGLIGKTDNIEL